jgi:hypothetical protein
MFLEIILMVILRRIPRRRRCDLCYDRAFPLTRYIDLLLDPLRDISLLLGSHEDDRSVFSTAVIALAIDRRRIV